MNSFSFKNIKNNISNKIKIFRIKRFLDNHNIKNYSINDNFVVDVDGDVYIDHTNLTKLPVQFGTVMGSFNISHNHLDTLSGCPHTVMRDFNCYHNKLTSLICSPTNVGGGYDCSQNELKSLEFIPENLNAHTLCSHNKLTTLKFAPKSVKGNFDCSFNGITNFEFAPEIVNNNFFAHGNPIGDLEKLKTKIGKGGYITGKQFSSFGYVSDWDATPDSVFITKEKLTKIQMQYELHNDLNKELKPSDTSAKKKNKI